jgi:hypothetical protein
VTLRGIPADENTLLVIRVCRIIAAALLVLLLSTTVRAQDALPVIKANSKQVSIQDGQGLQKDVWTLSPEIKLDTYYVSLPRKGSRVTFITDVESISFKTEFGKTYDFVILLGGKECHQRISATYSGVLTPRRLSPLATGEPDIIPFTMRGSRIYFEGTVNGNRGMAIQFDLGAGGICVNIDEPQREAMDGIAVKSRSRRRHSGDSVDHALSIGRRFAAADKKPATYVARRLTNEAW